jgi:hypothetical protein
LSAALGAVFGAPDIVIERIVHVPRQFHYTRSRLRLRDRRWQGTGRLAVPWISRQNQGRWRHDAEMMFESVG